ncbi:MAG: hypothetical protein KDD44_02165 [Bdellovibrionales bacterium]|nr:hypothetical protein [Bdellovibrionales bacterium]
MMVINWADIILGVIASLVEALLMLAHSGADAVLQQGFLSQATINTDPVGSVGTLVGAALETAGHYIQSDFLDVINNQLGHSLGALLYVGAALVAIFIIAVGGEYKFGLWFLIGPSLFWWLVSTRTDSYGANWQFGSKQYADRHVYNATEGLTANAVNYTPFTSTTSWDDASPPAGPAQVAWFFSVWNDITSDFVDAFISVVQLANKDLQESFLTKAERYQMLFDLEATDPKLKLFINITAVNECAEYYALLRELNHPDRNLVYEAAQQQKLLQIGGRKTISLKDYPEFMIWLKDSNLDSLVPNPDELLSCNELWNNIGFELYRLHATALVDSILRSSAPRGLKLQPGDPPNPGGMTDEEWAMKLWKDRNTALIARKFGMEVDPKTQRIKAGTINNPGAAEYISMIDELTARMLLKEFEGIQPSLAIMGKDHVPESQEGTTGSLKYMDFSTWDAGKSIRSFSKTEEMQGKGDFLNFTLNLPYFQGYLLYFLAVSYPFFCFGLIVPGRHTTLFTWMGLWAWVKSWDFGFAVVMLVDDILFTLLPHGPPMALNQTWNSDTEKVAYMMKSALEVDPTYSVHTYYNLLATCLMAIPVLTGFLVARGGREVMHAVNEGFRTAAGRIGSAMAAYQRNLTAQSYVARAMQNQQSAVQANRFNAALDSEIMGALFGAAGSRAFRELSGMQRKLQTEGLNPAQRKALEAEFQAKRDSWGNKAFGILNDGAKAASAAVGKREMGIASAKYSLNLAKVAHDESLRIENVLLTARGVGQNWYQHDATFGWNDVGKYYANLIVARSNLQLGGAAKAVSDGVRKELMSPLRSDK